MRKSDEQIYPLLALRSLTYHKINLNQSRMMAFFLMVMSDLVGYLFSASIIVWILINGLYLLSSLL